MKTFLLNKFNKPIIPWGSLDDEVYFIGKIPENHSLAISPGNSNIIILDVDNKNGKNGFLNIPDKIKFELDLTFWYFTKSGGAHYFLNYSGNKTLLNTSTSKGLDLRIGKNNKTGNNGGYVRYNGTKDIRECICLIKETSEIMNNFLESLFLGVGNYGKEITKIC